MYEFLMISFLIVAVGLIGLILVQHGKGADMGASFGAGASATMFGATGSGSFLTRTTAILATLFFVIALGLERLSNEQNKAHDSLWDDKASQQDVPSTPTTTHDDVPVGSAPVSNTPPVSAPVEKSAPPAQAPVAPIATPPASSKLAAPTTKEQPVKPQPAAAKSAHTAEKAKSTKKESSTTAASSKKSNSTERTH